MIILDTHILIWWVDENPQLSANAKTAIETELAGENGLIMISSITAWEIALLIQKERLTLNMNLDEWLNTVQEIESVQFIPVDNAIAIQSTRLPGEFHLDPADRMIVALARYFAVPLVTADTKIRSYKHVKTIW